MKFAIADPPYLGRGALRYGPGSSLRPQFDRSRPARLRSNPDKWPAQTTEHKDAHLWDDPETHRQLVRDLVANYDGWAIAMWRDSLLTYLPTAPADAHVGVWYKPDGMASARVTTTWEPVLFYIPKTRRARGTGVHVRDLLSCSLPKTVSHTGRKPEAWTHWVLNVMGYNPEIDTCVDIFGGSGAVAAAIKSAGNPTLWDTPTLDEAEA
jgi:hypothetical protein